MQILLQAAAAIIAAGTNSPTTTSSSWAASALATTRPLAIAMDASAAIMLEAPPCGTPEANTSPACIRWSLAPAESLANGGGPTRGSGSYFVHSDGTVVPFRDSQVADADPRGPRIVRDHGDQYLNTGQGFALLMSAGRCSYSTGWKGTFYADQDWTGGPGVGRPKKGAKPCS